MAFARADATRIPLPSKSVDLVIGSPPYLDARTYGIGAQRNLDEWVAWMLDVTREAVRVSRGLVIWVCAGVTRNWCYQPGPEGLLYEWVKGGGIAWRPCYWHRIGIPGSGGAQWYRADVEHVLCFTAERGKVPYGVPTNNGKPPAWNPGGAMSYRRPDGTRKEKGEARAKAVKAGVGKQAIHRDSSYWANDDSRKAWNYLPPEIANPGNLFRTDVGGGRQGHSLAHDNEAPYPVEVPAFFIRSHCPPGGTVIDPFSGSGTTVHAAMQEGRKSIGFDIRQSQCELSRKRCGTVTPGFTFRESN
jgi:hypothetical protein